MVKQLLTSGDQRGLSPPLIETSHPPLFTSGNGRVPDAEIAFRLTPSSTGTAPPSTSRVLRLSGMASRLPLFGSMYIMCPVGRYRAPKPGNSSLVFPDFRDLTIIFCCLPVASSEVYKIDFPSGGLSDPTAGAIVLKEEMCANFQYFMFHCCKMTHGNSKNFLKVT